MQWKNKICQKLLYLYMEEHFASIKEKKKIILGVQIQAYILKFSLNLIFINSLVHYDNNN